MAQQNSSEEVDLGTIFGKVRDGYHGMLISLYKNIQFLAVNWWILLILVVSGILLGYFWEKESRQLKEAQLYVQINFDAANYIYDAAEAINFKIQEKDTIYLKSLGLYKNNISLIKKIEIEPLVSISDILQKIDQENSNVETFLEQAQYEDNLLTSEIFISDYKTHKINIIGSSEANNETIESILAYLNTNKIINEIKVVTVTNTIKKIKQNNQNIAYMDSIAKVLGSSEENTMNSSQIYFNSVDNNLNNIHLLFREIDENIKDNKKLEVELLKYNNIVEVLNNPVFQNKQSLFDSKMKILPLILIIIYFMILTVRKLFLKAKKLSETRTSN